MKKLGQYKFTLLALGLIAGAALAFELWSFTRPGARLTSNGTQPNAEKCWAAQESAASILAETEPSRAELQALIEASADYCVIDEHGLVVGPICSAHPDACTGKLEEEPR